MPQQDDVRVRRATRDDAAAILALHVASIRELGPAAYDERQVAAWATKDHGPEGYPVEDDRKPMFVAEVADELAGFGRVNPNGEASSTPRGGDGTVGAEITAVYVHPDHVRRGVGSALLGRLEAEARDEGRGSLSLTASLNAVPFYERAGYEPVREVAHATTDEVDLTCLKMEKSL